MHARASAGCRGRTGREARFSAVCLQAARCIFEYWPLSEGGPSNVGSTEIMCMVLCLVMATFCDSDLIRFAPSIAGLDG